MASASETMTFAKKYIGYNYSKMTAAGMTGGHSNAWCADFVAFVLSKKGVKSGLNSSSQQFIGMSGWHAKTKPKVGDVFVFKGNNSTTVGHTGFVTSVQGDKFYTIEGNSGGKVSTGSYSLSYRYLVGFWTPPYSGKSSDSSKEITDVVIKETTGAPGVAKRYVAINDRTEFKYELFIQKGTNVYMPSTVSGIALDQEDWGTPGKLTFTVLKDNNLDFSEGSTVVFKVNGTGVFYGYVFQKSRVDENQIKVVAYDQLRYFKNSNTYVYKKKKASELLQMIIADFKLRQGNISDTGYVIPQRVEDNKTLFDIMEEALKLTSDNNGKKFYMYDNFGYIDLRSSDEFESNLLLNEDTIMDFNYTSSIENAYNKIQLYKDNSDSGVRDVYVYQDGTTISAWGVLQKAERLEDEEKPSEKGQKLLNEHNKVTRTLNVTTFGNYNIRPGMRVYLNLNAGDIIYNNAKVTVTKVSHSFTEDNYTMELTLQGGYING